MQIRESQELRDRGCKHSIYSGSVRDLDECLSVAQICSKFTQSNFTCKCTSVVVLIALPRLFFPMEGTFKGCSGSQWWLCHKYSQRNGPKHSK